MYHYYTSNGSSSTPYVKMTYPLLTRLLEYARESSQSDVDLHMILEEIMEHSGEILSMEHYEELLSDIPTKPAAMPAAQ